jgi:hypothetical protein
MWRDRGTIVAVETQQCILCVAELRVTVSCVTTVSATRQGFCSKFMLPATINVLRFSCKVPDAPLKQKNGWLHIAIVQFLNFIWRVRKIAEVTISFGMSFLSHATTRFQLGGFS